MLSLYVKTQMFLQSMKNDDQGQDLIEYALLGALISVACIVSMKSVATSVIAEFGKITAALT